MYVYILSENESCGLLYDVGFYDPTGKFYTESRYTAKEEAAARVHYLNGGDL